jgi:hypothetical protein
LFKRRRTVGAVIRSGVAVGMFLVNLDCRCGFEGFGAERARKGPLCFVDDPVHLETSGISKLFLTYKTLEWLFLDV